MAKGIIKVTIGPAELMEFWGDPGSDPIPLPQTIDPYYEEVSRVSAQWSPMDNADTMREQQALAEARKALMLRPSWPICKCCGKVTDLRARSHMEIGLEVSKAYLTCPEVAQ